MPIITQLKQQKNKNRINVYLDGEFSFGIDLENLIRLNLKAEQELSEKEIKEIIKKAELQKTFNKLLRFAMLRPRSEKEVRDWFIRKDVHSSIHTELFNRLKRLELLDDKKFAEWWIEQRTLFRPRGERALYAELHQKGIDKKTIADALKEKDIDQLSIAKKLIAKNEYKWRGYEGLENKQKRREYLIRKGFPWNVVEKVVK